MNGNCFVDTNILVYARDLSEPDKQAVSFPTPPCLCVILTARLTRPLPRSQRHRANAG